MKPELINRPQYLNRLIDLLLQKIVITGRYEDDTIIDGIPIINIKDWLLN